MRYGIIADIHGNIEALEAALAALSREKIDKFLVAGDIVGYGADPAECIKRTKALKGVIVCGNHDAACAGLVNTKYFNKTAEAAVLWTQRSLSRKDISFLEKLDILFKNSHLTLVHGTLDSPKDFRYMAGKSEAEATFNLMETEVCFVGHSHVPGFFSQKNNITRYFYEEKRNISKGEKLIVNAGSVGQPRDGDPRLSYAVYDTDGAFVQLKRVPYDIKKSQKKILEAGLPPSLARRLKNGM